MPTATDSANDALVATIRAVIFPLIQEAVFIGADAWEKRQGRADRRRTKRGVGTPPRDITARLKESVSKAHRAPIVDPTRPERVSRARRRKGQKTRQERKLERAAFNARIADLERQLAAALAKPSAS